MSWTEIEILIDEIHSELLFARRAISSGAAIFGAGYHGEVALRCLQQAGIKISCFIDNNPVKKGLKIGGIPVLSPENLVTQSPSIVFIAARHAVIPIRKQLKELELANISFDTFFVATHLNKIKRVRDTLLNDARSKDVYDSIIKTMITGEKKYCVEVMEGQQYFALPQFQNSDRAHFVDAGAYVGDTIERFLWVNNGVFSHIYAFEPCYPQFNALKKRMKRLIGEWALQSSDITLVRAGLGRENRKKSISLSPNQLQNSSFLTSTNLEKSIVPVYSLDSYLSGRPATFIKADIEGMEMEMLSGAKKTIQECKPCMALSIYHNPEHIYQIAEYVHDLVPEYRFDLRQHAPSLMETTLYCWVES